MSNPAAKHPLSRVHLVLAITCGLTGVVLFQFFGNATRGYVNTSSTFWWWISQWLNPAAETQHGWLILGLSGWVWWRNGRSRKAEDNPPFKLRRPHSIAPAIVALVAALALHALGFAAQQTRVSIIALLIFSWGVVRLAGGRRAGELAMFPLAFLMFAIPFSAVDEVGLPLRVWVTSAGEYIARAAGIEVLRSGTQLVAPDGRFNYDVAAPCSGVRSLVALTALSTLIGYLSFRTWTRRAFILALCLPLVYLGNVARIVAIVVAAQWAGPQWGERAHYVMGYGVFVIVLGGVLASVSALRRFWPEPPLAPTGHPFVDNPDREWPARTTTPRVENDFVETPASLARASASRKKEISVGAVTRVDPTDKKLVLAERSAVIAEKRVVELETAEGVGGAAAARYEGASAVVSLQRVVGVASVVLLAIAEMFFLRALADAPPRGGVGVVLAADGQNPIDLPAFVGSDWIGQRADVSAVERETLPADTGFSRRNYAFVADRKHDVFLSIVVSGRDRTSIHRPELCLVGQGWTIEAATRRTFRYAGAGDATASEFPASVLRVRREIATSRGKIVVPQLVSYWFVGGDAVVSSHWKRFAIDGWNRVTRGRTDRWAYVLVQTDATDGEAAALARMQTILDGTLPVFQRRLPAR